MSLRSPCIGVCKFEPTTGLCKACFRTRVEKRDWKRLPETAQGDILALRTQREGELASLKGAADARGQGREQTDVAVSAGKDEKRKKEKRTAKNAKDGKRAGEGKSRKEEKTRKEGKSRKEEKTRKEGKSRKEEKSRKEGKSAKDGKSRKRD